MIIKIAEKLFFFDFVYIGYKVERVTLRKQIQHYGKKPRNRRITSKGKNNRKILFLWPDYKVVASMGHIRDLPQKSLWIDIENGFTPEYNISEDKEKTVNSLKKLAKSASQVWIATDEDREWEAIGWHLCHALNIDPSTTKRIAFHEITKSAIQKAIENPKTLDLNLVDAQQARRLLDRLVWYKVSPVLWKKIRKWLSAGRVQSVAVKLIVEKEREIQNFKPVESWKISVKLEFEWSNFTAQFSKVDGKVKKLTSKESAQKILATLIDNITAIKETKTKKDTNIDTAARVSKKIWFLSKTNHDGSSKTLWGDWFRVMRETVTYHLYENW